MPAGARRVLGREAVVGPDALVLLAVREVRQPAADLRSRLQDVAAADERYVVGELEDLQVLGLRTLVEGRAVHVAIAAPREVREGAHDAGAAGLLEPQDPGLLQVVRAQAEGLEVHDLRQVADTHLVQHGRAEGAGQGRDDVLAAGVEVGGPERRVREIRRSQVRAGIVHPVVVEAVADEHLVLLGEVVVDAERELVRVQLAVRRPGVGPRARVGIRDEAGEVERLGRQPALGNDVAREGLARQRIVDPVRDAAEVAALHRGGGDGQVDRQLPALTDPFVAQEEVRLALDERAAQRPAELVPVQLLLLLHEVVRGVEHVVAHELEEPAVELAPSGLGGDVQHAARLAELGRVRALLHLHFLQGVDGGLDVGAALVVVGHVHSVDLERELAAPHAADGRAVDEVRADRHDARPARQARGPRGQAGQLVEAAAVQRQVDDLGVRHGMAERARLRVEQGRGGRHLHGLLQRAHLQIDVHAHGLPDGDHDGVDDDRLEPCQRDGHPVEAGVDRGHHVGPAIVGRHVRGLVGGQGRDGDVGSRHDGLLRVPDGAHDAPRLDLRPCRRGESHRQEQREPGHVGPVQRPSVRHVSSTCRNLSPAWSNRWWLPHSSAEWRCACAASVATEGAQQGGQDSSDRGYRIRPSFTSIAPSA